jgi:hypothetical protein
VLVVVDVLASVVLVIVDVLASVVLVVVDVLASVVLVVDVLASVVLVVVVLVDVLVDVVSVLLAVTHCENSDVFPSGSVAVAVMATPLPIATGRAIVKSTLPPASVVRSPEPRKTSPSPKPLPSHAVFEKSSTRNVVLAALLRLPITVVIPPAPTAEARTGKFCSPFGPVSTSPASFGVTPSGGQSLVAVGHSPPRSMPRRVFGKIEFPRMAMPLGSSPS